MCVRSSADIVSLYLWVGVSPSLVGDVPVGVDSNVPYCDFRRAVSLPSTSLDERDVPAYLVCFALSSSLNGFVVGGLYGFGGGGAGEVESSVLCPSVSYFAPWGMSVSLSGRSSACPCG